jgi:DNA-binding MarR family transcriptional regulator
MSQHVTAASIIAALADPTRRSILERLGEGARSVGEIAAGLPVTRSAVSQHLGVLKDTGLVRESRAGRRVIYALQPGAFDTAVGYLDALHAAATVAESGPAPAAVVGDAPPDRGSGQTDSVERTLERWSIAYPEIDSGAVALITRLQLVARLAEQVLARKTARHRINPAEFRLLGTLRRIGPPHESTPSELARVSLISAPGIVKRVDRLERLGLVARRPHPTDGRSSHVSLTPRGVSTVDSITRRHLPDTYAVAFRLSLTDRTRVNDVLQRLVIDLQGQLSSRTRRRQA